MLMSRYITQNSLNLAENKGWQILPFDLTLILQKVCPINLLIDCLPLSRASIICSTLAQVSSFVHP